MKTKSEFLTDIIIAATLFNKQLENRKRKPEFDLMFNNGEVLSAAHKMGLPTTGTPTECPIARAIVTYAYAPNDALSVMAAAEGAWEHYQQHPGQTLKSQSRELISQDQSSGLVAV